MLVVFGEWSSDLEPSTSTRDMERVTEAARLMGFRVYTLPPDFSMCERKENALSYVPTYDVECPGVCIGYIPSVEHYITFYKAALSKNIRLLNTPQQHQMAMEFDVFYPLLQDLTPESIIITSLQEISYVKEKLSFPVFLKGIVKSQKEGGWRACVANNEEEFSQVAARLLQRRGGSRGKIVVRKLVSLRHVRTSHEGFPLGREFRVFLYKQCVLAYGYYWEGQDNLSKLTPSEEDAVLNLAIRAAERLKIPYLSVDIGQLTDGQWIIIEVGDAQFSGLSQVSPLLLWNALQDALEC